MRASRGNALLRIVSAALALSFFAAGAAASEKPFGLGETLTFAIEYGFIRAGTAELRVSRGEREDEWVLSSRAWTNSFFDHFFKVRDEVRSTVDANTLESLRFEKRLQEGKFRDTEIVVYDRERDLAVYADGKEIPLLPGARDILASFYSLRRQRLRIGEQVPLVYHSSKKNWSIHVDVGAVETVKVPAGTFRCFVIEPNLKSVGVFRQTGRLRIWITADERRMPVKLESKVVFGAFEAVLTEYQ
ncbi:MAG: DUF3108 domain-containing protein [Candidatus Eisenbacteria bacterium]|nr:DUF3108 domain-containing protein [Candidatus Eisenbacteria bacterium]